MAAALHYAAAAINRPVGPTPNWCYQSGAPAGEICSATLSFLHARPGMLRLIGLGIVIASLGLMLPLPIPFSKSIPAWAVVLLAIGMMEKDCVGVAWLFNRNGHLGLYWSALVVRRSGFPEPLVFFGGT